MRYDLTDLQETPIQRFLQVIEG
jgi:hypothetical protein